MFGNIPEGKNGFQLFNFSRIEILLTDLCVFKLFIS
jgi:hypothetical protein